MRLSVATLAGVFAGVASAADAAPAARALEEMNIDDFASVWVQKDAGAFKIGANGDVAMARSDLAELVLLAAKSVVTGDLSVTGDITTNGIPVGGLQLTPVDDAVCDGTPSFIFDQDEAKVYICNGTHVKSIIQQVDYVIENNCLDSDASGLHFIKLDDEYYSVYCNDNGSMRLNSVYATYSAYYSSCGGGSDADCLPSASEGCTFYSTDFSDTGIGCDDENYAHANEYQEVAIEYVDEEGKPFTEAALAQLAQGHTSSGSGIQVYFQDATDNEGYATSVTFAGGGMGASFHSEHENEDNVENSWDLDNRLLSIIPNWFGPGKIPVSMWAGKRENFGVAMVFPEESYLTLTPVENVLRSCVGADAGVYLIDPAGQGDAFWGECDGAGSLLLKTQYYSYSTYYESCGGNADSDCTPTCDDGCYMEHQDGTPIDACCDDSGYSHYDQYNYYNIEYVSEDGFVISETQLDALVNAGIDTSSSYVKVWLYDATDSDSYDISVYMHHTTPSQTEITDYSGVDGEDSWDISNELDSDYPLAELFFGPGQLPSGLNAGTKSNYGIYVNFPDSTVVTTHTPKSCASINFAGIFDIDPGQTGSTFPVYCDGTGKTHLRSSYAGYSVYYTQCGGTVDTDCYPTCSDDCYLEDMDGVRTGGCCDEGNVLAAELGTVDFVWVDEDGNAIDEDQLTALALISDSSWSNVELYMYDSDDNSSYEPYVEFYGGGKSYIYAAQAEGTNDNWMVNSDEDYLHGSVGMHRIPKLMYGGDTQNIGIALMIGDSTLVLSEDSATRRTCVNVPAAGKYLLDPIDHGHAFVAECDADGTMYITPEYRSFAMWGHSKCGGDGLDPCAPTCAEGCMVDDQCCNELGSALYNVSGMSLEIRYLDAKDHLINPDQLDYFANYGFDTSSNEVVSFIFDGADADGYEISVTSLGDLGTTVTLETDWKTTHNFEEEWMTSTYNLEALSALFVGDGIIPGTVAIDAPNSYNFGSFTSFPESFAIAPPAVLACDFITDDVIINIDPLGDGSSTPVRCYQGSTLLRSKTNGYSCYYSKCGGGDDSDCYPGCGYCYAETLDGTQTAMCCKDYTLSAELSTNEIDWTDESGNALTEDFIAALADGMDSSWTNIQWFAYDATDNDGYEYTVTFAGGLDSDFVLEVDFNYLHSNSDDDLWDLDDQMVDVATQLDGLLGLNRVPMTVDPGTKENWGAWIGFASSYIVLSSATRRYDSCLDVPYTGTFLLDPAGSGEAFPGRCGADGTMYLSNRFIGYSVYYSKCGGSEDDDCTPTCDDGCILDDRGSCCDSANYNTAYEKGTAGIEWVDEMDNTIPGGQLSAIAGLGYDSSSSSDEVWVYDAVDASTGGYILTVSFWGDETDASYEVSGDWYTDIGDSGDVQNVWHGDTDGTSYDLSAIGGLFFGPGRIPASVDCGTKENWGVFVKFDDYTMTLVPSS